MIMASVRILISLALGLCVFARTKQPINLVKEYDVDEPIIIRFRNDYSEPVKICWLPPVVGPPTDICLNLAPGASQFYKVTVNYQWSVLATESNLLSKMQVVGGQHIYNVSTVLGSDPSRQEALLQTSNIVHVFTPSECPDSSGFLCFGPTWRDAVRRAAFRLNHPLCLCGDYNVSSSFTVDSPNPELPIILSGDDCHCDKSHSVFDMYMPCNFNIPESEIILQNVQCENMEREKYQEETRLFYLHTTEYVDRLSLKDKLWTSLRNVFGVEVASLIMPSTFLLQDPRDLAEFTQLCKDIVSQGLNRDQVFIMKDVAQHQQHGIRVSTAEQFLQNGIHKTFNTATEFSSDPYLWNGYKLNMRRYVLAVCTGGRLRVYVHDDGKNIYAPLQYREPWEGDYWGNNETEMALRLKELITTGYVPEEHYNDKPLTGMELFRYLARTGIIPTFLQTSMWSRLAMAFHASRVDGMHDLCDMDTRRTNTARVPSCLHGAIRFQHFGCDFHIDGNLSGFNSRLFECNKGPDFSVHSLRDGVLKRDVAADILSFVGFKGKFDGTNGHARRHRMNLIYDSDTFSPEGSLRLLKTLEFVVPSESKEFNGAIVKQKDEEMREKAVQEGTCKTIKAPVRRKSK